MRHGDGTCDYIANVENMKQKFVASAMQFTTQNPFSASIELPTSHKQALQGRHAAQWQAAFDKEIQSLQKLGVYKLVNRRDLPPGANIITGKWVFKVKPRPDGSIERFKVRLCARGFLQRYGVDFTATFSPVASSATIKLLLAIAAKLRLKLCAADIATAFLFGALPKSERVYMEVADGIRAAPGQVMELHRCIYGLKQASRRFFERLSSTLLKSGYAQTKADPCLYLLAK